MIYLDYNAASPLRPEARLAILEALDFVGNASSVHRFGRLVRKHLESARHILAEGLGTLPKFIIFTSGATEANNIILGRFPGKVIVSAVEHDAVRLVRTDALICPVDEQGILDVKTLEQILRSVDKPVLVSVMHANHETGVIQPLTDILALSKRYGALVHTDGAQAVGKLPWTFRDYPVDYLTLSGSKLGALQGVGAIAMKDDKPLMPLHIGGGQERSYRPGTENVIGIVSLGAAFQAAQSDNWGKVANLRDDLEGQLKERYPEITIFGEGVSRLPNTSTITMPGVKSETQVIHFDMKGIAVSAGAACSSGKVQLSPVLHAMGVAPEIAGTALRVSLGPQTTQNEIARFIGAWEDLFLRCHGQRKDEIYELHA